MKLPFLGPVKSFFSSRFTSPQQKFVVFVGMLALLIPVLLVTVAEVSKRQDQQSGANVSISSATNCSVSDTEVSLSSQEQSMLQQVNQYRQQNGLSPLNQQTDLNRAAAWFSKDLYTHDARGHIDSLGRDPAKRTSDCGYAYPNSVGENTGGSNSVTGMLDWWKGSDGHNQQLLKPTYKTIGVGNTGDRWVLVFSLQDGSTSPTSTKAPTSPTKSQPTATRTPTRPPGTSITPTSRPSQPSVSPTPMGPTPTTIPVGSTTVLNISVSVTKIVSPAAIPVTVRIFNTQNQEVALKNTHLYYAQGNIFRGQVDAGVSLPTGYYTMKIKGINTLQKNIEPYIQHVENKKTHQIPLLVLVQGDLNNDNLLSAADIESFFSYLSSQNSVADLNYDGMVDVRDYSILISSFAQVIGD